MSCVGLFLVFTVARFTFMTLRHVYGVSRYSLFGNQYRKLSYACASLTDGTTACMPAAALAQPIGENNEN